LIILDDGNILIGVNAENKKQVITEDIRLNRFPEIIKTHEAYVFSLLANKGENIFWAGLSNGSILQYACGPANGWKIQVKYSGLQIESVYCLSLFGNLLFAGGNDYKVCIINTADKKVHPMIFNTAIKSIRSLQICVVSPSETYLTVTGRLPSYSDNKTDLYNVSEFQQITFAEKIFSKPEFHINSINYQFNYNSPTKELPIDDNNSKVNNLS
jgi:hypothetical protein